MTEADFQLAVSSVTPIVVAVCGTITAIYAARAHKQGQINSAKIDTVQGKVDGASTLLASNLASSQSANEEVIRTLAASTITPKPPPENP